MAILGYAYLPDIAGTCVQGAHTTNPKLLNDPPYSTAMRSPVGSSFPNDWYRKKSYDDNGGNPTSAGYSNDCNMVLFVEFPADSTELWLRFLDFDSYPTGGWANYWNYYRQSIFAEFFNISNGVKKLVGRVQTNLTGDGNSKLCYYLFGDDGATVIKTHVITPGSSIRSSISDNNLIVDLRLSFDKVAGFIQHYDQTATRISEVLGQTINNLPITHIAVNSDNILPKGGSYCESVFRIVANEPTFGMYVMPFYAKAEGTDQQQLAGTFSRFTMGRNTFKPTSGITLEKPDNGNAMYSFVPKTLTESGLPANHNILSMQVNAVLDGSAATADPISVSTYLKHVATGNRFEKTNLPVKNNVDFSITSQPQVRSVRWDKNPVSGQNWQPGDLADFEIGFKV